MPTVCISCAIRALLHDEPSPVFDETPEAHQRRVHPNLQETLRERRDLERALQAKLAALHTTPKGDR